MQPRKIPIAVVCGLIAGLVWILLITILYLGGVNSYLGGWSILGYIVLIVLAVIAPIYEKKAHNGFLEFKDALQACFLVFVIGLALQTLFNWILLNYIDQPFRQAVDQVVMQKTEQMLHSLGISQEKIDEVEAKTKGENQFSLSKLLMGLAFWYIVFFLVSLLIAAIVKKKKPEFNEAGF